MLVATNLLTIIIVLYSWSQKNPEGRSELIEIFKKAGREQGLVGLKPIAILKGKFFWESRGMQLPKQKKRNLFLLLSGK